MTDYLFELVPWKKSDVDEILSVSRGFFKYFSIPEGPGGYPGLFSIATAMYIKYNYGVGVYPHIRLYDVNRLALLSIANAVREYGLDGLVLLRGDKPWKGRIVEDIGSEEALELLKRKKYGFDKGLILSLNYPVEKILERIKLGADFYLVINYSVEKHGKLVEASREARGRGSRIYVFILLGIGRNRELFRKLGQPYIEPEELKNAMNDLDSIVDGYVLSSPFEPVEGIRLFIRSV